VKVSVGVEASVAVGEGASVGVSTTTVGVAVDAGFESPSSPPQPANDRVREMHRAARIRGFAMPVA
jgi:hypothetical protein